MGGRGSFTSPPTADKSPSSPVTWYSGNGAPTMVATRGSLYSRIDGATGTTLYVSQGGGTWAAVAGV